MYAALQKHGARHVYRLPEGLRELCSDISREVLRAQPEEIYSFIADYIDALLITRENAKVAVRVVNNILIGSESIVGILHQSGLSLEQIAVAATRIQKVFRSYLDLVDVQQDGTSERKMVEENSRICIREILKATGTSWEHAEIAASTIQAAFRSHYEEMLAREARGEVQWQRAVVNTIAILRKAGVSQEEAAKAVTLIQSSYRGYYIRRNIRLKLANEEPERPSEGVLEPRETIQAVAWMDMMFQDSKHTIERANEAATTIQAAFRGYRARNNMHSDGKARREESSKSMVVEAILENIQRQIWDRVKSSENFPEEYGSREEMEQAAAEIQMQYKNKQRNIRISEQLTEDSDEDRVESVVEKTEAVDAEDFIQEAEATGEFEVVAEPISEQNENLAVTDVLKEDAQMTVAQVVVKSEPHEHSEDQEESVAVDEPEIEPVTILEPAVEAPVGIEHHEAHEENELATEVERDGNEKNHLRRAKNGRSPLLRFKAKIIKKYNI